MEGKRINAMLVILLVWALAQTVIANQTQVDMEALKFFQKMHDLQNNHLTTTAQRIGPDQQSKHPSPNHQPQDILSAIHDQHQTDGNQREGDQDDHSMESREAKVRGTTKDAKRYSSGENRRKQFTNNTTEGTESHKKKFPNSRRMNWFNNLIQHHRSTNNNPTKTHTVATEPLKVVTLEDQRLYEWFKKRYSDHNTSTSNPNVEIVENTTEITKKPDSKSALRVNAEIDEVLVKLNNVLNRINKNQLDRNENDNKAYFFVLLGLCKKDHEKHKVHGFVRSKHYRVRRNADYNSSGDKNNTDSNDDTTTKVVFVRHNEDDRSDAKSNEKGQGNSKVNNTKAKDNVNDLEEEVAKFENTYKTGNYANTNDVKNNQTQNTFNDKPPQIPNTFENTVKYVGSKKNHVERFSDEDISNLDEEDFKLQVDPNNDIPLKSGRRFNNVLHDDNDVKNGRRFYDSFQFNHDDKTGRKNSDEFEDEKSVKNKLLSYIDTGFTEFNEKLAPLENVKDYYKNDNAFKTGYISASLDTLQNNLGRMKKDLDENRHIWNEKHVLDFFETVNNANNVAGKLMDTVRDLTDTVASNNRPAENSFY